LGGGNRGDPEGGEKGGRNCQGIVRVGGKGTGRTIRGKQTARKSGKKTNFQNERFGLGMHKRTGKAREKKIKRDRHDNPPNTGGGGKGKRDWSVWAKKGERMGGAGKTKSSLDLFIRLTRAWGKKNLGWPGKGGSSEEKGV